MKKPFLHKKKETLQLHQDKPFFCFLDIDGVLNRSSEWHRPFTLNVDCINLFCETFYKTNVKIILVSTWKNGFINSNNQNNSSPLRELENHFNKYALKIYGKTTAASNRTEEINLFLKEHSRITDYIIIDDDNSLYTKKDYLITPEPEKGFSEETQRLIIRTINQICE